MDSVHKRRPMRIERPPFLAKIINYEYWPWYLFFLPMIPVWLYYALRSGKAAYFTAANPAIPLGGLFGESKSDILNGIPHKYKPAGWKVKAYERGGILTEMASRGVTFPVIIKPDVGERGYMVRKIENAESMYNHLANMNEDIIVQEFIDMPIELGVMYHRFPGQTSGRVTSVTIKEFLCITGNGKHSIRQLMMKRIRTKMQMERLEKNRMDLDQIPGAGEKICLEPIGNHCLGTTFLNGNQLINDDLNRVFDEITMNFEGFHYGRFDIKVHSIESLYRGEDIRVFEVNGVTSEAGHIYDPGYSLFQAYRDTARHMGIVFRVSRANQNNGTKLTSTLEVIRALFRHFHRKNKTPEVVPRVPSYISEQI